METRFDKNARVLRLCGADGATAEVSFEELVTRGLARFSGGMLLLHRDFAATRNGDAVTLSAGDCALEVALTVPPPPPATQDDPYVVAV
jgi:hypothetical protein